MHEFDVLWSCASQPDLRLEVRISLSKQVDSLWENQMENWGFEENTKMWYLEAVCKLIFLSVYIITCLPPDRKYNTGALKHADLSLSPCCIIS